ncbi:DUF2334 domain-containing protein [Clostridium sp. BJN0001]|uniref:DUF2334 domain-containing protein n=1 Tax=Clostridium sp. BJN0001 TaxID=2930219 RepID=UPI001FCFDCCB|nr:DUF2334 domain-containing protein [Clostridium sp. BJN0001]
MSKNISKKIIVITSCIVVFAVCAVTALRCTLLYEKNITIINNKIYSSMLPTDSFSKYYTPELKFEDTNVSKINDVSISLFGEKLKLKKILLKSQRYYIPLNVICNKLKYNMIKEDSSVLLSKDGQEIILNDDTYNDGLTTRQLRGKLLTQGKHKFIAISDIEQIFNLFAVFDFDNKSISLIQNVPKQDNDIEKQTKLKFMPDQKVALIRLEDFGCGDTNTSSKNQTKTKIMVNFLYNNNIKFHVGWVPRFVDPSENIDNDLLTIQNITNVGFIDVLDYIINKGGQIGIHGYTHQDGDTKSISGEEMSKDINNTKEDVERILKNSINTASALNIPYTFFESPHYSSTYLQKSVVNKFFQYSFEPYDWEHNQNIYKTDTNNLYVPAPLGRVKDVNDMSEILDGFKDDDQDKLHALYYHPSIELDYIDYSLSNNKMNIKYDEKSPLKKIVRAIEDNGYTTIHIDELKTEDEEE